MKIGIAYDRAFSFTNVPSMILFGVIASACVWVPLVFAAYAFGRRKVGLWFFFALVTAEAIGVWLLARLAELW